MVSPPTTDGTLASSLLIITVCELERGKAADAVAMGTPSRCRATCRKLNFSVSTSARVAPVKDSARFALPRRNSLFSLLSHVDPVGHCCYGNIAVRLYRMWLEPRRGEPCLFTQRKKLDWMQASFYLEKDRITQRLS